MCVGSNGVTWCTSEIHCEEGRIRNGMTNETFKGIEKLESDLWEAADNLRANSKLTSSDYFMPVLGVIFLRHAANRFEAATRQIKANQASGKMPKRKVLPVDYLSRRALWLPEKARSRASRSDPSGARVDEPSGIPSGQFRLSSGARPRRGPRCSGHFRSGSPVGPRYNGSDP